MLVLVVLLVACPAGRGEELPVLRRLPPVDEPLSASPVPAPAGEAELPAAVEPGEDEAADLGELTWYEYALPSNWHVPDPWEASFELGVDGSAGNSETLTMRTGADFKRKKDWSDLRSDLTYVRSSTERVETKHNARWNVEHDWLLKESRWSLFGKSHLEYNEFMAYDLRWTLNAGLGYRFIKREATTLKGRFGAGVSREFGGTNNVWSPEAVFGIDFDHQLTKRQKIQATLDYTPEWGDFNDYRLRSRVNWEVLLDEATNMSLKLTLEDRYDSTPEGRRPNDLDYSVLLLWKL